jgi:hypothetical protein
MKKILGILAITLAWVFPTFSQTFLTNGLVAYYPFTDGSTNDFSGNGNNGVVIEGAFATDRFGQSNSCLLLNNTNLPLPDAQAKRFAVSPSVVNNLSAGTIFAWINPYDITHGAIFAKQHAGANTYAVFSLGGYSAPSGQASTGTPGMLYFHPQNGATVAQSTVALTTNAWQQVCVTFTSTNCTFYINGSPAGTTAGNFTIPDDTDSSIWAAFGAWAEDTYDPYDQTPQQWLNGELDDIYVFSRALASNEVTQLYEYDAGVQITQNPTNFVAETGQNATLSVSATANQPLSYQWYFVPATGLANSAGQAGAYAELAGGFVFGGVVTNGGFGYGNVPGVSFVGGNPSSPASGYVTVSNATVTGIVVTNAGYGYTSAPAVVIGSPDGLLPGQTNTTLTISNISTASLGSYFVAVSDSYGSTISSVANLTLVYPPSITVNPAGYAGVFRSSGSLSVSASGTAPLSYQWFLAGTNLPDATNSSYDIASLTLADTGAYTVEVTNLYGSAISSPADVDMAPDLSQPFGGVITLWGQNTSLAVGAIGSGPLSYQWYFNGVSIPAATGSNYDLGDIQFTNAGLYSVVVSSPYGSVTNTAYQVVVNPAGTAIGMCPIIYITGTAGYTYTIQSTADLSNTNSWTTITNLTIPYTPYIWADTANDTTKPGNSRRFYRILGD